MWPLATDLSALAIRGLLTVSTREYLLDLLGVSEARLRSLEHGKGRLFADQLELIEGATGFDWQEWVLYANRLQSTKPEQLEMMDDAPDADLRYLRRR